MSAIDRITIEQGRTTDIRLTLFEDDGSTAVNIAASDVCRFKLHCGDNQGTPDLDLDEAADTSNSSGISRVTSTPAVIDVRFAQGDTSGLRPGIYRGELTVVDDSETAPANAIKHAQNFSVAILGTPGGDVGLT